MGISIKSVLKGGLFAVIITFIIIMILALLSYFTQVGENVITVGIYAAVIVGVLLGSVAVSKAAEHNALLHALLVCVLYFLVLVGVSVLANGGFVFNTRFITVAGAVIAAGLLGCIIGK